MFLPSGEVFLIKTDNTLDKVMSSDISSLKELQEEIDYLFNKCGYNKNNFIGAKYVYNQKTIYEIEF